jgi:carboxyl-terminal processing protease
MLNLKSLVVLSLTLLFCLPEAISANQKKDINEQRKSRFEKLELFNRVLYLVESQYYREVDPEKLIQGAIKGMMSTLDPHSNFLSKDVFKKMQEDTSGQFDGIGIEVSQKDGVIVVITPIEDAPAFKAGVKSGDRIVEINGESIIGSTLEEAVEKLKGKINEKISIGVLRDGNEGVITLEMKREHIKTKSVKSDVVQDEYVYVRLTQFQKRSSQEIVKALKKEKKKIEKSKRTVRGILLDLRSNPGGLLDEAVNVSSIFLRDGVVVSTEGRDPKQKEIRYVKKSGHKEMELPVVVLINGSSASASEIVAGALQDHKRALVLGTKSFGKGSVQTIAKVDDAQGIKLTIAQYMTPVGRKIQAIGITPDVTVSEFEGVWSSENRIENKYIREKDLQNHLTATIETEQEKKDRVKAEREEKKKRIARIKKRRLERKNKKSDKDKKSKRRLFGKGYAPSDDYQVIRAVDTIKSFEAFKGLKKL